MKKNINLKMAISNLILLIAIILFIGVFSKVFGISNTLSGVAIVTALLMLLTMKINLDLKNSIIAIISTFLFAGFASYISKINCFCGIFINFIAILYITYLFKDSSESTLYIPFILGYIFMESTPISFSELPYRLLGLLFGGCLVAFIYYLRNKKEIQSTTTLKSLFNNINFKSARFIYAIKMALGLTIAMFIGNVFNIEKYMWICVTVMSLTQPSFDFVKEKIKHRFLGTILGSILFVLLFLILVPDRYFLILTFVLNYIYMFAEEYHYKMTLITINSLNSAQALLGSGESILFRIAFIILGIFIAFIINKNYKFLNKFENDSNNFYNNSDNIVT